LTEWHDENLESFAVYLPVDDAVSALETYKRKNRTERVRFTEGNAQPAENQGLGFLKR